MNFANIEHHQFKDDLNESSVFARRSMLASLCVLFMISLLVVRFYNLQIVHYESYTTLSDSNRIQVSPIAPNRGLIFDRNGELIAENRPSFTLSIISEYINNLEDTIHRLSQLVSIDDSDRENFHKFLKQRRRPFAPIPLRFELTKDEIAILAVNKHTLKGIRVKAQLVRHYPRRELFAHTIGYVGRINEKELNAFDEETTKRYEGMTVIGKIGIEKFYEKELLGKVGYEYSETNAHGRRMRLIDEEQPTAGQDLHLFLDSKIQRAAAKSLGSRRGAVVAIDVKTGGVLAVVSTPSFDPNLFVTGISYKNYRVLYESKDLPLFNRSIQGQYPPGSTLKPMLGLGGLEENIITSETTISDPGYFQLPNDERKYRNWKPQGHGNSVNLHQAIVESCDTYFYEMAFKMGVDRMHAFGLHFGLGEKTGIDMPSERRGLWPSREWKKLKRGISWYPGNSLNMSIGQGDVLSTPLQLASMTATMASKGRRIKPRLVSRIGTQDTMLIEESYYQGHDFHWSSVHQSMKAVVHSLSPRGTALSLGDKVKTRYTIAGKTGTAQVVGIPQGEKYDSEGLNEEHRDHALFIGFAPSDAPEVAIAVIVENGEQHSNTTFPVAKAVFDEYFESKRVRI